MANGLSPPAAEQPRSGTQAAQNKMSFETLMRAIKVPSLSSLSSHKAIKKSYHQSYDIMTKVASELRDSGSGLSSVQPPASLQPRPNNIDFTAAGELTEAGQLCVTQAGPAVL